MSEEIRENRETSSESTEAPSRPKYRRNREDSDTREPREGRDRESGGGYKSKAPKKKICRFCAENIPVDYRNTRMLRSFITERSKIVPGRISGTCAAHQRELTIAIKRARQLALIPYTSGHNF
ncbi:MAG: 30S ribosomal protein S18 [bacterium]